MTWSLIDGIALYFLNGPIWPFGTSPYFAYWLAIPEDRGGSFCAGPLNRYACYSYSLFCLFSDLISLNDFFKSDLVCAISCMCSCLSCYMYDWSTRLSSWAKAAPLWWKNESLKSRLFMVSSKVGARTFCWDEEWLSLWSFEADPPCFLSIDGVFGK